MAIRAPLYYSAGNLKEMTSPEVNEIISQAIYQYSLSPSVSLSVVSSGGSIGSITDTRQQAGVHSTHASSFPPESTTAEPTTVTVTYDKINQKRNIEVINLNDVFEKKFNFSDNQIESYFDQNKDAYKTIYKSIKFIVLNPKNLTGNDEISDLFFQKVDEIDDLIVEGENLDFLSNKFNLESSTSVTFNELNQNKNFESDTHFPNELIKKVFDIDDLEPTVLIEHENKYFIVEVTKAENIQRKVTDQSVKKEILLHLEKQSKRKLISKECYFKSSSEMIRNFQDIPESISNTLLIAKKCSFMLETSKF